MSAELQASRIDSALILTMSNPGAGNALHPDMYAAAIETLSTAERDDSIRAVILTGAGDTFCAGVAASVYSPTADSGELERFVTSLHGWIEALRDCPKPVIAAVESEASGAGFALALACDFIVAGSAAQFSMPSARQGLTPDSGTWLLAQSLPRQAMLEILIGARPLSAGRLHGMGVVNRLADDGDALSAALAWSDEIAALPGPAIEAIKSLARDARGNTTTATTTQTTAQTMVQFSEIEKQYFLESLHWGTGPDSAATDRKTNTSGKTQ